MYLHFPGPKDQPEYLTDLIVRPKCSNIYSPLIQIYFLFPVYKLSLGQADSALWNSLSVPIRDAQTNLTFRKLLKSHLFDLASPPELLGVPVDEPVLPWIMTHVYAKNLYSYELSPLMT